MDGSEARALLEREMEKVDEVIEYLIRRHGLVGDRADAFRSEARFKLVADDYSVLRKFSGRSSLRTYLVVVLANAYRDYRVREWGKWRPSAAAKRMGHIGVLLDTYIHRDGHSVEEAVLRASSRTDVDLPPAALRRMASQLPRRVRRSTVPLPTSDTLAAAERADRKLESSELAESRRQAVDALERGLARLPVRMQAMVRLRYCEGVSVADIARQFGVDQKPLYRKLERALFDLRVHLEKAGVRRGQVLDLIE